MKPAIVILVTLLTGWLASGSRAELAVPVPPCQATGWKRPSTSLPEAFVSATESLSRQG